MKGRAENAVPITLIVETKNLTIRAAQKILSVFFRGKIPFRDFRAEDGSFAAVAADGG